MESVFRDTPPQLSTYLRLADTQRSGCPQSHEKQ